MSDLHEDAVESSRPFPSMFVIALLAVGLAISGAAPFLVFPICIEHIPPRPGIFGQLAEAIIVGCILYLSPLLGLLLAWLSSFSQFRSWNFIWLLGAWLTVPVALISGRLERRADIDLWMFTSAYAWTIAILFMTWVLTLTRLGRATSSRPVNPLFLFVFVVYGCAVGVGVMIWRLEFRPELPWTLAETDTVVLCCLVGTGVLFLAVYGYVGRWSSQFLIEETSTWTPSPGWLRRLRWMLLGGMPACVIIGATSYVNTDLAPLPFWWLLPWTLYFVTWMVALARMTHDRAFLSVWLAQVLALSLLMPALYLTHALELHDTFKWGIAMFLAALLFAPFMPHFMTAAIQGALLAVVLLQMYSQLSFGLNWAILAHLSFGVVACWGCHGDAVKHAAAPDRLPDFLFFVIAGIVAGIFVYAYVVPHIFAMGPGPVLEYTIALVASVVVRVIPWPKSAST